MQPQQHPSSPLGKENDSAGANSPSCKASLDKSGFFGLQQRKELADVDASEMPSPATRACRTVSLSDRVRAEAARAVAAASQAASQAAACVAATKAVPPQSPLGETPLLPSTSEAVLPSDSWASQNSWQQSTDAAGLPELEPLRHRFRAMSSALRRSNVQQAEMQCLLAQALDRCEALRAEEAEAKRAKEHHHHRWCVLDQEREGLQRVAQQAQTAERAARAAERSALDEAAAWRRWLASFMDVLLRRGAATSWEGEETPQSLEDRHPRLHSLLQQLSKATEKPTLQPELLSELPSLYDLVAELIADGRLAVKWGEEDAQTQHHKAKADADERIAQLERKLAQKEIAYVALEHEKRALRGEVRALQNTVQELRGSIRVFCRIRPPKKQAAGAVDNGLGTKAESSRSVALKKPPGDRRHDFSFDRVFSHQACQRDLYEEVEPLLPGILEGIHVCIFAYGQTGAGKTYTLAGNRAAGEAGLQDLAIADLLRLASCRDEGGGTRYEVRLTALEIYNESIQDLLVETAPESSRPGAMPNNGEAAASPEARLEVRQSREGLPGNEAFTESNFGSSNTWPSPFGSMRVPGLRSWPVRGPSDVDHALQRIAANRHVAATALNERSSRSHCVLSLSLMQKDDKASGDDVGAGVGVLHIVDLAGSERTKISQAEGMQMKEANCINRSLSALSDVLYALGDSSASAHVPYRNSKLTYLLQDALGGPGCKTFLFAQVSPDGCDSNESYSTLTFASRVATSVQKGRLRPSGGSSSAPAPRGSPPARSSPPQPSRDASPRSDAGEGSFVSSPAPARGRIVAPQLPGLNRKPSSSSIGGATTPERRPRSQSRG
eukprot:TRINITY_DN48710_c0_g1_i1.p1 TRINITY_DN48710_c0_g1~~TRINITY_DN48710_c0_g1_i1.p1  ORF type:complete len:871 (-),score=184.99 TRINITY_DN48710_c0_g1_i1:98-2614(-)